MNTLHSINIENPLQKTENQSGCENYFLLLNTKYEILSFSNSIEAFFTSLNCGKRLESGKQIFSLLPLSHTRKLKKILANASDGVTSSFEMAANEYNGKIIWIKVTITPTFNHEKELVGFACTASNIEKERLKQKKIQLQNLALSQIAKSHAHEVRHPLTNILGIINLLKHEQFQKSELLFDFLEISAKQLDDVIKQIIFNSYTAANN